MDLEQDRAALERLKQRVDQLRKETDHVHLHLRELESRFDQHRATKPEAPRPAAVPPPLPSRPAPAPIAPRPPAPPLPTTPAGVAAPGSSRARRELVQPSEPPATPSVISRATPSKSVPQTAAEGSLEMKVGTYWLVRVGIVMLLTALVFFGKYAYQNFIGLLGPVGKVSLLYLAGGTLLGLGAWLPRGRESLRNYGQVLFAGGLATVYFTTYAAHHIETLRVIGSPLLDGVLLLGWTGYMIWMADRRKSEVLAVFALGLAFYAAAITQVGAFTLFSNLLLTAAALLFLVRNRWTLLTTTSLVAAYATYTFWRFHPEGVWRWAGPEEGLWTGATFLMAYWVIFTAAVFLTKNAPLQARARISFLTANNLAFYLLFLLTMAQVSSGGLWRFCLVFGGVLLGVALVAQRQFQEERWTGVAYCLQGLTLVTLGLILKFSGAQLGLILAAESVILLTTSRALSSRILQALAQLVAALAALFTLGAFVTSSESHLLLGLAAGGFFVFEAWWTREDPTGHTKQVPWASFYFSGFALVVWWLLALVELEGNLALFPVLAAAGLALTFSYYTLRVRALALLAQGYLMFAQLGWALNSLDPRALPPAWSGLIVLGLSLAAAHWWQRQQTLTLASTAGRALQALYAMATVVVLGLWLEPRVSDTQWLILSGALAMATAGYGLVTRSAFLAAAGQLFAVVAVFQFIRHFSWSNPTAAAAVAPVVCLALLAQLARLWLPRARGLDDPTRQSVIAVAAIYTWTALAMGLAWIHQHVPAQQHVWVLALIGAAAWGFGAWRRDPQVLFASFVPTGLSLLWLVLPREGATTLYALNLVLPLMLVLQQRAVRRWADRFAPVAEWQPIIIVLAGATLWWWVSQYVQGRADGFYLTAAWAGLALLLFVGGLLLRERAYRWSGLAVLGLALGRVVLVDVWRLDTLYRMISFFALGVVLLALGFLYNRYQERIRQWL